VSLWDVHVVLLRGNVERIHVIFSTCAHRLAVPDDDDDAEDDTEHQPDVTFEGAESGEADDDEEDDE
jgi:hypothetical protein